MVQEGRVPSVQDVFSRRIVLVTGATGFMGKVLLEKLLRCCPDLATIYIILRPKKDLTVQQRLDKFCKDKVFGNLEPKQTQKLIALAGDVKQHQLGLQETDFVKIKGAHFIFHCAATVKFDESLKEALLLNTHGTLELVTLASKMENLQALVHVSTAYSNADLQCIEEIVYPAKQDYHKLVKMACEMLEKDLEIISPQLLGSLPNTYVLSKSLAENVVHDQRGRIPAAIVRPSIVCPAVSEPYPGWVDSYNGPIGILVGASAGVLRSVKGDGSARPDLIPVDYAINTIIVAAWNTAVEKSNEVRVYNATLGEDWRISWDQFLEMGLRHYEHYPSLNVLWYPGGALRTNPISHFAVVFFLQIIPAFLYDTYLLFTQQKPWLLKLQRKIHTNTNVLEFFISNEWNFCNGNLLRLLASLRANDQNLFGFNPKLNYNEYVKIWVLGTRRYINNLEDSTLPEARAKLKRLFCLHVAVQLVAFIALASAVTELCHYLTFHVLTSQHCLDYQLLSRFSDLC